ncbi:hypothetical protein D9615_005864 [Tricholomella constricta]|uniref:C3H1-type domain-containing protein n=1 Tax=Tricholomella constricta TaxID=117010 RepID=A0A8H5HA28_9AGAR|nr:hypothetical protein D9615_005864 [Tricholomella constricta]
MSDNYARLFSTNQPGREGQSNTSQPGREEQSNTSSQPDSRGNGHSTVSTHETVGSGGSYLGGRIEFEPRVTDHLDSLITEFREGRNTKANIIFDAHNFINSIGGSSPDAQKFAFGEFISTIDSVEILADSARRRGERAQHGLENAGENSPTRAEPAAAEAVNDAIDQLVSKIGSKRGGSQVPTDADAGSGREDDVENRDSGKRRKLSSSDLPWHSQEILARQDGRSSCQATQTLLYTYERDPAWVRRQIIISGVAPSTIPPGEWDSIFRGTAVNLDAVFSSVHHVLPPKEDVGRVGSTEIRFSNPEPSKRIRTSSDWTTAWDDVSEATTIAFPHRARELKEYGSYIRSEFSAKLPISHPKIILFDIAIRNFVGGGQRYLLTDYHLFSRFHSAIIAPDGVESAGTSGTKSTSGLRYRSTGKRISGNKTEVCHRFNDAGRSCPNSPTSCRYLHACKSCGSTGHGQRECVQGRHDSRGSS